MWWDVLANIIAEPVVQFLFFFLLPGSLALLAFVKGDDQKQKVRHIIIALLVYLLIGIALSRHFSKEVVKAERFDGIALVLPIVSENPNRPVPTKWPFEELPPLPEKTATPTLTPSPTPTPTDTPTPTPTSTPTSTPIPAEPLRPPPPPPNGSAKSTPTPPCYGTGLVHFLGLYNGQVFDREGSIRIKASVNYGAYTAYSIRYLSGPSGPEAVDKWSDVMVDKEPLGSKTIDYIWFPLPSVGYYTIRLQLWGSDNQFDPQSPECAVTIEIQ